MSPNSVVAVFNAHLLFVRTGLTMQPQPPGIHHCPVIINILKGNKKAIDAISIHIYNIYVNKLCQ